MKFFRNLKVSKKLLFSFGLIVFFVFSLATSNNLGIGYITKRIDVIHNNVKELEYLNSLNVCVDGITRNVLSASIVEDDTAKRDSYINEALSLNNELKEQITTIENISGTEELSSVLEICHTFTNNVPAVWETLENDGSVAAIDAYRASILPLLNQFTEAIDEANRVLDENVETNYKESQSNANTILIGTNVWGVACYLACIFIGIFLTKYFTVAIKEIRNAIVDISNGKLDTEILHQSKDEFGETADVMRATSEKLSTIISDCTMLYDELAKGNFNIRSQAADCYTGDFAPLLSNMRVLATDLSATISQIYQSAEQVNSGSVQIADGAQTNSQGATEQAGSIEELAAAVSEISDKINKNAADSNEASRNITAVGKEAEVSNARMKEMLEAMHDISTTSSEIGNIIKTIEDIAFQTNILALNAAVEAARAGDAGKGFAVVADEVRNLASKTADASQNTAALIQRAISSVENGSKIADETAKSLSDVVKNIEEIVATINRISAVSDEQAVSIAQVTTGIDQISSVVQTNSATAEQSAAASEELSAQASTMKDLVSRFTLRQE